jgi:hypothetical protein
VQTIWVVAALLLLDVLNLTVYGLDIPLSALVIGVTVPATSPHTSLYRNAISRQAGPGSQATPPGRDDPVPGARTGGNPSHG